MAKKQSEKKPARESKGIGLRWENCRAGIKTGLCLWDSGEMWITRAVLYDFALDT